MIAPVAGVDLGHDPGMLDRCIERTALWLTIAVLVMIPSMVVFAAAMASLWASAVVLASLDVPLGTRTAVVQYGTAMNLAVAVGAGVLTGLRVRRLAGADR